MKIFPILVFTIVCFYASAQIRHESIQQKTLREDHIGTKFKYLNKDRTLTYLTYLGKLHSDKNHTYKVVTSVWIWSSAAGSRHATSRLLIFDDHNKYFGEYYGFGVEDLPLKIVYNKLLFSSDHPATGHAKLSYVSFKHGIPKELYNEPAGDLYVFDTTKIQ